MNSSILQAYFQEIFSLGPAHEASFNSSQVLSELNQQRQHYICENPSMHRKLLFVQSMIPYPLLHNISAKVFLNLFLIVTGNFFELILQQIDEEMAGYMSLIVLYYVVLFHERMLSIIGNETELHGTERSNGAHHASNAFCQRIHQVWQQTQLSLGPCIRNLLQKMQSYEQRGSLVTMQDDAPVSSSTSTSCAPSRVNPDQVHTPILHHHQQVTPVSSSCGNSFTASFQHPISTPIEASPRYDNGCTHLGSPFLQHSDEPQRSWTPQPAQYDILSAQDFMMCDGSINSESNSNNWFLGNLNGGGITEQIWEHPQENESEALFGESTSFSKYPTPPSTHPHEDDFFADTNHSNDNIDEFFS